MRNLMMLISTLCVSSAVMGVETVRELSWREAKAKGELQGGELLSLNADASSDQVVVENTSDQPRTIHVWSTQNPGVTKPTYAIIGHVSCKDVQGAAYLEMMNHFSDSGPFFSRTLGKSDPSRPLTGTASSREFVLPFHVNDGSNRCPTRLDFSVHFPGRGIITIGPIRLVQYEAGENPIHSSNWWTDQTAGLLGGIGGSIIGCLGGLIGVLCSLGRGRVLALGLLRFMFVIGISSGAAGIVALARTQPYEVYYPLLLSGLLCSILPLFLYKLIQRRFQAIELQRLHAADAT